MAGNFLHSVSQLFSNVANPATQPPAAAPAPVAQTPAASPAPAEPASPLDNFKTLWEPVAADPNNPVQTAADIFKGADPNEMLKAARGVDFAKTIPAEVLAKITAGGPDAATAFAQAINDVSQRAYAQSTFASTQIISKALTRMEEIMNKNLPNQVRGMQINEAVSNANPAFNHPALAPLVQSMVPQMAAKYPNASPQEVAKLAQDYVVAAFGAVNPTKPVEKALSTEVDWFAKAGVPGL